MANKCSVTGCFTNYARYDTGTVFPLPDDKKQKEQWLKFIHRSEAVAFKNVYVCYKHFAPEVMRKTPKRVALINERKPVPTIIPETQKTVNLPPAAVLETIKTPRKPPAERIFRKDEIDRFQSADKITSLEDINEKKVADLGENFKIDRQSDCVIVYCLDRDSNLIPRVTFCIKIEKSMCIKLFYLGVPIPLPHWFLNGRSAHLTSWSMMPNFISHMKERSDEAKSLMLELNSNQFKKRPLHSNQMIRYALELRYTSLQAYKILLKELNLPSVSYLNTLTSGE